MKVNFLSNNPKIKDKKLVLSDGNLFDRPSVSKKTWFITKTKDCITHGIFPK
jgi:hypothetical protein